MKQTSRYSSIPPAERLPEWLRRPIGNASDLEAVQGVVKQQRLHTICEEGRCPNRGECYAAGTATFLLGGRSAPAAAPSARSIKDKRRTRWIPWKRSGWPKPLRRCSSATWC